MRRSTDFMFVINASPVLLRDRCVTAVALAVGLSVPLGVAAAYFGFAVSGLLLPASVLAAGKSLAAVLATAVEYQNRCGWAVPSRSSRAPSAVAWAAVLAGCALAPIVGPLALLLCILALLKRPRGAPNARMRDVWRLAQQTWWLHLCYIDRRYDLVGGWYAIWTPRSSMTARLMRVVWLFVPVGLAAGLWLGACLGWLGRMPSTCSFIGLGSALACTAVAPVVAVASLGPVSLAIQRDRVSLLHHGPTEWDRCAALVRQSTYEENGVGLAEHVFMGFLQPPHFDEAPPYGSVPANMLPIERPYLMHRSVAEGHGQICGQTQTGKSAIAMVGLISQVARGMPVDKLDSRGRPVLGADGEPLRTEGPAAPVLFLDLKGDPALFNTVREDCASRGQPFHAFTLEPGLLSSYFSAVEEFDADGRPSTIFTEILVNALSLSFGASYGRSYYTSQHRDLLFTALQSKPRPRSWTELYQRLIQSLDRDSHRDVFELLSKVRILAEYPQLGKPPAGADVIRMRDVLREGHCAYFWLPANTAVMSVVDAAKLALFAFLTEARDLANAGKARRSFVFIDEIQTIAGDNLAVLFQQCASTKVTLVTANQSIRDLDAGSDKKLSHVVRDNVAWRAHFSIHDPDEAERWIKASGEKLSYLASYGCTNSTSVTTSQQGASQTVSNAASCNLQPVVHPRINQDTIRQVNYTVGGSLLQVGCDGRGGTPLLGIPHRIWTPWPLTWAEYERRSKTPWPKAVIPPPPPASPLTSKLKPASNVARGLPPAAPAVNTRPHREVELAALAEFDELDALYLTLRSQRPSAGKDRRPPCS